MDRVEALEYEREVLDSALLECQGALEKSIEAMKALPVAWVIMDDRSEILRANPAAEALLLTDCTGAGGGSRLSRCLDDACRAKLRRFLAGPGEARTGLFAITPPQPLVLEGHIGAEGNAKRACRISVLPMEPRSGWPGCFAVTLVDVGPELPVAETQAAVTAFSADPAHFFSLRPVAEILNSEGGAGPSEEPDAAVAAIQMQAMDLEVLIREDACNWMVPMSDSGDPARSERRPAVVHKFPIRDAGGRIGYVGTIGFFLKRPDDFMPALQEKPSADLSSSLDTLTGCASRAAIMSQLESEIVKARRGGGVVSLCSIDLDDFKSINDSLGHEFGDQLLRKVAHRLQKELGGPGFVGRLSGDEFLAVLPGKRPAEALAILQELMEEFHKPISISGVDLITTCSMGVAGFPEHAETAVGLMRAADLALYQSKSQGRDMLSLFDKVMVAESDRKQKIINALHRAIACEEFRLVYQPQFSMSGATCMVGVEALLRWNSPDLGDVSPAEFIPLGYQCGLGLSIDLWVMKTAFMQVAAWGRDRRHLTLSVNTSASSFLSAGFARNVVSMIGLYRLDPARIQIEVTETTLMQKARNCSENLRILREAGVSVSVDDFGTGYSSLSNIHDLNPSELKIDRSFVTRISEKSAVATKPLELILSLANTLGLRTVAEGIETKEQFDWLRGHGCEVGQGFFLCGPLPLQNLDVMTVDPVA
jgi:diguanylate cyclase (GGDEF)-like protein